MARRIARLLFSAALFAGACAPAYADRVAPAGPRPLVPIAVAPDAVRSPYSVDIVADDGGVLDTFFHKGRYYVRGASNRAYTIRINNPTPRRVEAVISVDGLDVIDGENGDLRKRGYIVPPYGEVRIDGWRTSLEQVAAFRFSSVGGSYAGRKGKARNVGVIAVAIFAEEAPAVLVAPPYVVEEDGGYGGDVERYLDRRWQPSAPAGGQTRGPTRSSGDKVAPSRPAPPPPATDAVAGGGGVRGGAVAGAPRPYDGDDERAESDCCGPRRERQGLGTEFGESRYSAASYTRFVRAGAKPIAIAELRYNDDAGLKALGILVEPEPDPYELEVRETANPFPGDHGFARPPAGIR